MGFGLDIGIDLGTSTVLLYIKGKGIVLNEPSVVALDEEGKVLAVGEDARMMLGRTPSNITAIRPLRDGVISDYETTEKMLKHFINKVCGKRNIFFKPRVMICVPSGITEVERMAVKDAADNIGAKEVYIIEEPIAAAIGAGLDISKPYGSMIVDIGGGTADIAVMSLGGVVTSKSIKTAGDKLDEAIIRFMRKKHSMLIGERMAEEMKMRIGCVYPKDEENSMKVRGRNLVLGLPRTIEITSTELMEAFEEAALTIEDAIRNVLEKTPPELAADIGDRGVVLTGGGSLIDGLDKLLSERTGLDVMVADDAISCVALGTGEAINDIDKIIKAKIVKVEERRKK
ncbi:MAG: rod shape-determining protein MreB [Clostridiales bacterium]|nr:rod shape-determining protein MreB [Clostridiales bacterium]